MILLFAKRYNIKTASFEAVFMLFTYHGWVLYSNILSKYSGI